MAQTQGVTTTPITGDIPENKPYTVDEEKWRQLFVAVSNGDISTVMILCNSLGLGPMSYDIERLTTLNKYYGPLESNGDALAAILQSHTKGKVDLTDGMRAFLLEAKAQADHAGKPLSDTVRRAYYKIMNGQDLDEEEAKALYGWCVDMKELVIPSDYRSSILSEQIKQLKNQYDTRVQTQAQQQQRALGG